MLPFACFRLSRCCLYPARFPLHRDWLGIVSEQLGREKHLWRRAPDPAVTIAISALATRVIVDAFTSNSYRRGAVVSGA